MKQLFSHTSKQDEDTHLYSTRKYFLVGCQAVFSLDYSSFFVDHQEIGLDLPFGLINDFKQKKSRL